MRNTHITTCSCEGKYLKVGEYALRVYAGKVVLKLRYTHVTTCSCHEKCLRVVEYAYHYVLMPREVCESCGILISLRFHANESV